MEFLLIGTARNVHPRLRATQTWSLRTAVDGVVTASTPRRIRAADAAAQAVYAARFFVVNCLLQIVDNPRSAP
jgi:hypothetical protein